MTSLTLLGVVTTALGLALYWATRDTIRNWIEKRKPSEVPQIPFIPLRFMQIKGDAGDKTVGVWETTPVSPPSSYETDVMKGTPILMVANLKGGVGKTTVTAHLSGHFAKKGLRVLAIDLDFQGSLTTLLCHAIAEKTRQPKSRIAAKAIAGEMSPEKVASEAMVVPGFDGKLHVLGAFYNLDKAEMRMLARWLAGFETRDIRYTLAELLHSKAVQLQYDIILIDAPPRLTTSSVQALAASTHILVPTVLDHLSGEAVSNFLNQVAELKVTHRVCPYIQIAGVVGSMTKYTTSATVGAADDEAQKFGRSFERTEYVNLEGELNQYTAQLGPVRMLPQSVSIPELTYLHEQAAKTIAYEEPATTLPSDRLEQRKRAIQAFDRLGEHLWTIIKR